MRITKAKSKDKKEIYDLWKSYFSDDDGGYTDFFFSYDYDNLESYLIRNESEIISCLQIFYHKLVWRERIYDYAFIVGVLTSRKYRNQGYMKALLDSVLPKIKTSLTLIQGYKTEIYYPFGFSPYFTQKQILIKTIDDNKADKVIEDFNCEIMLELYQEFTKDKNGYRLRDPAYYKRLEYLNENTGDKSIIYYENESALAYALYSNSGKKVEITELIYSDIKSARVLLAYLGKDKRELSLKLMKEDESFKKETLSQEKEYLTLVRFNNHEKDHTHDLQMEMTKRKEGLFFNEID